MSNGIFRWGNRWQRRVAYGTMAFLMTLSLGIVIPRPATAGLHFADHSGLSDHEHV